MTKLTIIIANKRYSSWSLRGWLAVRQTGLPYEEVKLPLDTPEFYERISGYTPAGTVPALNDGDIRVWDSLAIIDYCARIAPEKYWWPEDARAYATARSIAAEMHSGFMALRGAAPMNLRCTYEGLSLAPKVQKNVTRIDEIWQSCRNSFGADGDFLFGDFSAADMMYAPVVARMLGYGISLSDDSAAYAQAVRNHPFVRDWYDAAAKETAIVEADEIAPGTTCLGG